MDGSRWRCKVEDCSELVEQSEMEEHLADAHKVHALARQEVLDRFILAIGSPSRGYYRRGKTDDQTEEMFPDWKEHSKWDKEQS